MLGIFQDRSSWHPKGEAYVHSGLLLADDDGDDYDDMNFMKIILRTCNSCYYSLNSLSISYQDKFCLFFIIIFITESNRTQ